MYLVSPKGSPPFLYRQLNYCSVHSRFLDWHGEPHARIERNFSVYGTAIDSRTWLVKSLSMVLFFAPDFHLRMLQNMWVDNIMHKSVWHESMRKMHDEWQEFVLFVSGALSFYMEVSGLLIVAIHVPLGHRDVKRERRLFSHSKCG